MTLKGRCAVIFCFYFLIFAGGVCAQTMDAETVEQIRKVQDQQKWLLKDYNEQVRELHDSFKEQIAELSQKETTDKRRNQIISDLNSAETELKNKFQMEMNELQQEEKRLRVDKKEEPDVEILTPEEDRPLTPEERLQKAEEKRLELQEKLLQIQEEQGKKKKKRRKRRGSIGKNIRESDDDRVRDFEQRKKNNSSAPKTNFNVTVKSKKPESVKDLSGGRSRTNR